MKKKAAILLHLCVRWRSRGGCMNPEDKFNELRDRGYCVLHSQFSKQAVDACREAFQPILLDYLERNATRANRGPHRHFLPMPFEAPCFAPEFFFDPGVLTLVRRAMDDRVVADQWGCDVPVRGSQKQEFHVDYQRPLFPVAPELTLPCYMLVASFGLTRITADCGPIEIVPGTHRMPKEAALRAVCAGEIGPQAVPLEIGDVLIRHPWALHRGTPNTTDTPRALVMIRYVRQWFADSSREVSSMPRALWESLTPDRRTLMRFPPKNRA